ncbi:MAG TPA: hypothetical protein VFG79_22170 [Solirubrobacter sp.]|nr:hypothetical protein [Solirubrobacter sp.]
MSIWAPRPSMTRPPTRDVDEHADILVDLLRQQGPLDAKTLRARAGTRYWGPGCFGAALRRAREQGRIRRAGRRTYAAT